MSSPEIQDPEDSPDSTVHAKAEDAPSEFEASIDLFSDPEPPPDKKRRRRVSEGEEPPKTEAKQEDDGEAKVLQVRVSFDRGAFMKGFI